MRPVDARQLAAAATVLMLRIESKVTGLPCISDRDIAIRRALQQARRRIGDASEDLTLVAQLLPLGGA